MLEFRRLTHEDYGDILDISKGVWDGGDYLPQVFHKWVDDEGYFLGVVDTENNKVVGVGKFSILEDKSGWLEGLRVHRDYRGQKMGRVISEKVIEIAKGELQNGNVNKIAFSSHITNVESITLMGKLGFKLKQEQIIVTKEYDTLDNKINLSDFTSEQWDITYEEFSNLPYLKRRNNLIPLAFIFQEPSIKLFEEYKKEGYFVKINGFKGIARLKGEVNFIVEHESFEAIDTFMNYYLLKCKDDNVGAPVTYVLEKDIELIEKLKDNKYTSWAEWKPDYVYFVYE